MEMISAFVGPNGHGKTLTAMKLQVVPWLEGGRPVLSNTPIFASEADAELPWEERLVHPLYVPLVSWRQLGDRCKDCLIFFDEISSMFDSRDAGNLPSQANRLFNQLRKDDNSIIWTAPDWDRCDKVLRRVTQAVTLCSGHRPRRIEGRQWKQNRLIKARTYNATRFEEFSLAQAESDRKGTIRSDYRHRYRVDRCRARQMYSTYAPVELLDHVDQAGLCGNCGLHRKRKYCQCPPSRSRANAAPLTLRQLKERALYFAPNLLDRGINFGPEWSTYLDALEPF